MKTITRNEQAQAGVGTLIIFIAMVLVAAVAAAVLIQTSGVMQSKSTATTKEAAAAIGENLALESIDGYKAAINSASLQYLNITVKVAAGGSDIDLTKVLLKVNGQNFNFTTGSSAPPNTFWVYSLREASASSADVSTSGANSYATNTSTLKPGALARVDVNVSALTLAARSSITLAMTPEKGATLNMQLTTPALGSTNIVSIYP
jgi:flagellin FlaB